MKAQDPPNAFTTPRLRNWLSYGPRADTLAVVVLLTLSALYAWLTWSRAEFWADQAWYMQVSARMAASEVLYRDVYWHHGPLPVYALSLVFQLLGVSVDVFFLLSLALATAACLLTYRAARFLLPMPLALLGTAAVFLGGGWQGVGGFLSYIYAYSGAVSLGAVLGLLFVVSLLSYLKSGKTLWLVVAGVATGGALLTKPEFALACTGTGLLFLGLIALFPGRRRDGIRALAIYAISAAAVAGVGYGLVAHQAGWSHIWAGITGYGKATRPSRINFVRGTFLSWAYIVGGLGIYLIIIAALVGTALQATRKRLLLVGALAAGGLTLIASWGLVLASSNMPKDLLLMEGIRLFWAPGTLLLTGLIVALGVRWLRAYRRQQAIEQTEWFLAVLTVYSALLAVRFYFSSVFALHSQYVDTLFPVLLFSSVVLIPRALERWAHARLRPSRVTFLAAAILVALATAGFVVDVTMLSQYDLELMTPRGLVRLYSPGQTSPHQTDIEVLQYIISHTAPGDSIVVLGDGVGMAGYYFLSGRQNPLRQDGFKSWMGSSPAEVEEIARRLEMYRPRLVVVCGEPDAASALSVRPHVERHGDMAPIWQYVQGHYQVRTVIGDERSACAIYELLE